MRRLRFWIIASVFCWANAYGQVTQAWTVEPHQALSFRSAAGTCSGAGTACDHLTLIMDGRSVIFQLTEFASHYMQFAGRAGNDDPTLIDLYGVYLDGHQVGSTGQCVLFFKDGDLSQVICSALGSQFVFTGKTK